MNNFSFGIKTTASNASTGVSGFGGSGFSFGSTSTSAPSFNFGSPVSSSSIGGFGSTLGTKPTTASSTQPTSGFTGFGTGLNSTQAGQPGLGGFGTTFNAPQISTSFGSGFFTSASKPQVSTNVNSSLFQTTTTVGLGGLGCSKGQTTGLANNEVSRIGENKSVKDQVVQSEILAGVEQFSAFVKEQKHVKEEISKTSNKVLLQVQKDCIVLRKQVHELLALLQKNSGNMEKYKRDAIQDLKDSEIAQRTRNTAVGLQLDNLQPIEYFQRLIDKFESQMSQYRSQLLEAEQFFSSINRTPSPTELSSVFEKLNEGFMALAARLQVVHEAVQRQKDTYLRYKKTHHYDHTDIFKRSSALSHNSMPVTTVGPSPFSTASIQTVNQHASVVRW